MRRDVARQDSGTGSGGLEDRQAEGLFFRETDKQICGLVPAKYSRLVERSQQHTIKIEVSSQPGELLVLRSVPDDDNVRFVSHKSRGPYQHIDALVRNES